MVFFLLIEKENMNTLLHSWRISLDVFKPAPLKHLMQAALRSLRQSLSLLLYIAGVALLITAIFAIIVGMLGQVEITGATANFATLMSLIFWWMLILALRPTTEHKTGRYLWVMLYRYIPAILCSLVFIAIEIFFAPALIIQHFFWCLMFVFALCALDRAPTVHGLIDALRSTGLVLFYNVPFWFIWFILYPGPSWLTLPVFAPITRKIMPAAMGSEPTIPVILVGLLFLAASLLWHLFFMSFGIQYYQLKARKIG